MGFLESNCTFRTYNDEILTCCTKFNCGHADLNDFFENDSLKYSSELLGKSYCFILDEDPQQIVCAFTISNDSIKTSFLPNSRKKKVNKGIPRQKRFRSYPAVLIGRLGVSDKFKGKGIGQELMEFIKSWFIDSANKTGCRFIVVDSYNEDHPIRYYQRNGFEFLFSSDRQEKKYMNVGDDYELKTRLMYFDLIQLAV